MNKFLMSFMISVSLICLNNCEKKKELLSETPTPTPTSTPTITSTPDPIYDISMQNSSASISNSKLAMGETSVVTITLKDSSNNKFLDSSFASELVLSVGTEGTSSGTFSAVEPVVGDDGVYQTTFTASASGTLNKLKVMFSGLDLNTTSATFLVLAQIETDDILVSREPTTRLNAPARLSDDGSILVFSSTGTFKGFGFIPEAGVSHYTMGMKLGKESPFGTPTAIMTMGSTNSSLQMQVKSIGYPVSYPQKISPSPTPIPGTDSVGNYYFQFGHSQIYYGNFYLSDYSSSIGKIYRYTNYNMPSSSAAWTKAVGCTVQFSENYRKVGDLAMNIYGFGSTTYIGWFGDSGNSSDMILNQYGVSKFTQADFDGCTGTMNPTLLYSAATSDEKVIQVVPLENAGGTNFTNDIFIVKTGFLGGTQNVVRIKDVSNNGTYTLQNSILDIATAGTVRNIFHIKKDNINYLYTWETNDSTGAQYIRKYNITNNPTTLVGTIISDETHSYLPEISSLGYWMLVAP